MTPCTIPSCPDPGTGRTQAGDMCVYHWDQWETSQERKDLLGANIEHAPEAFTRFVKRQEENEGFRRMGV